ncbi:MAG: rhodanese domain-containing protein [Elusimicrobia bacterium]|nr:MAG: rhodanese domain-containing protein [Elusimicrobiota bacterium]KAF0151567.1 MAG: rhodanese domain-containing protein [Elusimicrobiota bacterium]
MAFETINPYILPALVVGYLIFRQVRVMAAKKKLPSLAARGAVFVDVRTPGEFAAGNRPGSVNIPLDSIAEGAKTLDKEKPVILSCVSGARSGVAAGILKKMGFKTVVNAGPWQNTL